MRQARAVCLDLDDTLWELGPALARAEQLFHNWLAGRYPAVAEVHSVESLRSLRQAISAEFSGPAHDLSAQRRELYRRLAASAGEPTAMADEAFTVFQGFRNQVTLYDDVRPALVRLRRRCTVVALTNGNADIGAIGLGEYFVATFTAAEIGVAKPDAAVFRAVSRRLGLDPAEIVHAGDHPHNDVVAARLVGMRAVWVNRVGAQWPAEFPAPEHMVSDLHGLADLLGA